MAVSVILFVPLFLAALGSALPVDPRAERRGGNFPNVDDLRQGKVRRHDLPDTPGLELDEYHRYWKEMAKDNPMLRDQLKQMNAEELAKLHPRVSERVARDTDGVRNRLEEARRVNLDEMRELQRLKMMNEEQRRMAPDSEWIARQQALRDDLPENFKKEDIQKRLDEQRRILEEIDHKRREEFEHYQMQQEHQRREKLRDMNEHQRLQAEQAVREYKERQKHHEKLNKPASKQQFEEVWEEDDGLKDEEFDPKTFFFLHDTNGDKILDPMELQALFYSEVKKAYGKDIDNVQMQEELARMREYALNELDRNKDSMVSLEEFISYTHGEKFEGNEEWKPLTDEEEAFTEEEMNKFEEDYYDDYYDYEYDEHGNIIGFKDKPSHPQADQPPVPEVGKELVGDPDSNLRADAPAPPVVSERERGAQHEQQTHIQDVVDHQQRVGDQQGHMPDQQGHRPDQQGHRPDQQGHQPGQGEDEGVPGQQEHAEIKQHTQQDVEGMPGQLHIEPAGTQKEGQAQQFHKNPEHNPGVPGNL